MKFQLQKHDILKNERKKKRRNEKKNYTITNYIHMQHLKVKGR